MGIKKSTSTRIRKARTDSATIQPQPFDLTFGLQTNDDFMKLAGRSPWPALGRKGSRAARKELASAMERAASHAHSLAFNQMFADSMRLRYPANSGHFMRMYLRALENSLSRRERGSGFSR